MTLRKNRPTITNFSECTLYANYSLEVFFKQFGTVLAFNIFSSSEARKPRGRKEAMSIIGEVCADCPLFEAKICDPSPVTRLGKNRRGIVSGVVPYQGRES